MKCNCGQNMRLVFHNLEKDKYKFFWGCMNYPDCKFKREYESYEPKIDIAGQDTMTAVNILNSDNVKTKTKLIDEIKVQMPEILNHFIDCTWGAHYMTLFKNIIIPYLDNAKVLDFVLKGSIIREEKGNVYFGDHRAKMFRELYHHLRMVKSGEIQNYLTNEFNTMHDKKYRI